MKKTLCIALCLFLFISINPFALATGSVPGEVIKAKDSVVRVLAEYSDGYSTGSGFVVQSDKESTVVVTNYHVVEGHPHSISVWLSEEETVSASILAYTDQKDMCLLKLAYPIQITAVPLSKDGAKQGDAVYAVGFPSAADILSDKDAHTSADATITDGIVSAVREATVSEHGTPVSILQINAAINHGNSGGPLFNAKGEVVGITTYGIGDSQGIFGAIDVSELKDFLVDNGITESKDTGSQNWIWYALPGGVIVFAAIGIVVRNRMKKKKSTPPSQKETPRSLREYMTNHPEGVGPEEAVGLLLPVAIQLRDLHNDGKAHLQVSSDTILVSSAGTSLNDPTGSEANRYASGYAAPEIYRGGSEGNLSDIYSFCAALSFATTGKQPENALSREEVSLKEEVQARESEKDPFTEILEKGTALNPAERFASMQELIIKLSPFNTKPAAKLVEAAVPETEPTVEKKKRRLSKKAAAGIAAAAILITLVGGYLGCYFGARSAAAKHEFQKAEKLLIIPGLTKLHDNGLVKYVDAGKLFEERKFDNAKEVFASLPGFLDADDLVFECDYRHAAQFADANDFDHAISLYTALECEGYKDAAEKVLDTQFRKGVYLLNEEGNYQEAYNLFSQLDEKGYSEANMMKKEAQYRWAWELIDAEDYIGAYKKLESIQNYSDVKDTLAALTEAMFYKGVDLYHQEKYNEAREYFYNTSTFMESENYLLLIAVHNESVPSNKGDEILDKYGLFVPSLRDSEAKSYCKRLTPLIGFEDAAELLVSIQDLAEEFLRGTWNGEGYYFSMNEEGHISYNLPFFWYGDYYRIEKGVVLKYPENDYTNTKPLFSITVVSSNCIKVYCYQDSSTHTLYRQ